MPLLLALSILFWHGDSTRLQRVSILPLPLVYYTPETRLAYGVATTLTIRPRIQPGPDTATLPARPSQLSFGIARTLNRQLLFYLPFSLFLRRNTYYLSGELGYYRYNYYYYGLGTRETAPELYGVNFPRVRLAAFRRLKTLPRKGILYGGMRYQYEDYQVTSVEPGGQLAGGEVPGGRGSRLSGLGLGLFLDRRDHLFFPTRGSLVDLTYLHHAPGLGGNVRFDRYVADVATYHALGRHGVLALNGVLSLTRGEAPFNALSLLGGTRRMRGYYEGRFRDQQLGLLQAEVRFDLYGRLGGVVFGSLGVLGTERPLLRLSDPKTAGGAGLRFTLNRRDHLNLRLDYGLGRGSGGLYVTIGEAF